MFSHGVKGGKRIQPILSKQIVRSDTYLSLNLIVLDILVAFRLRFLLTNHTYIIAETDDMAVFRTNYVTRDALTVTPSRTHIRGLL